MNAIVNGGHDLILSNEIIVETIRVLRYPKIRKMHFLTEEELYAYVQFLRSISEIVVLDHRYHAPLRDSNDLNVMQTAERGGAGLLCTHDADFHEPGMIEFCSHRGIEVCSEATLLARLRGTPS